MNKNFKRFLMFVALVVIFPLVFLCVPTNVALAESENRYSYTVKTTENVIKNVLGTFSGSEVKDEKSALKFFDSFKEDFEFSSAKESLLFKKENTSIIGKTYKFNQIIDGIEVFGAEINLSVKKSGEVSNITGVYFLDKTYDKTENYNQDECLDILKQENADAEISFYGKYIYDKENKGYIVYIFDVVKADDQSERVFVSAKSGKVCFSYPIDTLLRDSLPTLGYTVTSETITDVIDGETVSYDVLKYQSTTGSGYFYVLADSSRKIYMANGENKTADRYGYSYKYYDSTIPTAEFNDDDAIKAYLSLIKCYDFYADENSFGYAQEGIKNYGKQINLIAIVHYDTNYENAGYSAPGSATSKTGYFLFGDGDLSKGTKSFVNGLDVVGHEYQHALTDQICSFVYQGESGALSEAFSDIFGAVIEGKGIANKDFWRMGEDVAVSDRFVFRDMSNPSSLSTSARQFASNYETYINNLNYSDDNQMVHFNATLPTYATYLMYKQDPAFFTEYNILQLWYTTLQKMTTNSGILDFCENIIISANELSYSTTHRLMIEKAFASLGIPGYTGVESWNGNSLAVLQGSGTVVDPYLVNNLSDLASVSYYVNNNIDNYATARYKLTSDITISANTDWLAIGNVLSPFNGLFNGNDKTITINLNAKSSTFGGLFGICGENSTIYNLNIKGKDISTSSEYAGAIAMKTAGAILNCSSTLNISGENVGGLVGLMENSDGGQKIASSYVYANLSGKEVGGLVCHFSSTKNSIVKTFASGYISSCYYRGTISATELAGGIVARANAIYIVNDIVYADFDLNNNESAKAGGLVGKLQCDNLSVNVNPTGVYNFMISNKVYSSFKNCEKSQAKLLANEIVSNAGEGYFYVANNTIKSVDDIEKYNNSTAVSSIVEKDNKLSTDKMFVGDFDFDSKAFFENADNWTNLETDIAFDSYVFEYNFEKMPQFTEFTSWWDYFHSVYGQFYSAFTFKGTGSTTDPYQISDALDLTALSYLMMGTYYSDNLYNEYANKYYILTNDIDLSGRLWASIGFIKHKYVNGVLTSSDVYGFAGHFDGNGHTIKNIDTTSLSMTEKIKADGSEYYIYEFGAGLFGATSGRFVSNDLYSVPEIKNLTIENVRSSGTYASALVAKAYEGLTIDNVTVMDGKISSSYMAGGLVAKFDGRNLTYSNSSLNKLEIRDSYVLANISGTVVGGAVGYMANASSSKSASLLIANFLMRGKILAIGLEADNVFNSENKAYAYYRVSAGSFVGTATASKINIVNSINLADVESYTYGANLGGFIGSTGVGDYFQKSSMEIVIDGAKQIGKIYYVFEPENFSLYGNVIGKTNQGLLISLSVSVLENTYSNSDNPVVFENGFGSSTISSNIQYSESELGEGDFDIYNKEYFSNGKYFNANYAWTENTMDHMYFTVVFMVDGKIYDITGNPFKVKQNQTISAPKDPSKESTTAYKYTFKGWDKDFSVIKMNMTINAVFDDDLRVYKITFVDEDGNVLEEREIKYGESVNQNVSAPEKKGNFFIEYEFVRWGEKNQTVSGDATVAPVYEKHLTKPARAIVALVLFSFFITIVVVVKKNSKFRV